MLLWLYLYCIPFLLKAQDSIDSNIIEKNGVYKHSTLSTHPFGVFFSRLNNNFKKHVSNDTELSISLESGNVWGPEVKTYIPNDDDIRNLVSQREWHQRQYILNEDTISAKTFNIKTDGVIKGLRANITIKINNSQEVNLGIRTYMLTRGKFPFSVLSSDNFIEKFHNKVAGGEDPFDRSVFGLNEAQINYTDRNGRQLAIENGDFIATGIESAYYWYPEFLINDKKNLHINIGGHLGTNLSKYNSSFDIGMTSSGVKDFSLMKPNDFSLGFGLGILRKNIIDFKSDNLELGTNDFIGNLESVIEYHFVSKGNTTHAFSANFYFQTSLNSKKEYGYIIPIRTAEGHKAWGHGTTNLYKNNDYWTLMYTFSRKVVTSFYLQQDFTVNNNPDIQTGVSMRFRL
jgi:hypothetical protein